MTKMRVHELAKELGYKSKEIIDVLEEQGEFSLKVLLQLLKRR